MEIQVNATISPYPQPITVPISDEFYQLTEDFEYVWKKEEVFYRIVIRKGYKFDGASVPRWLWSISGLHPSGLILAPAVIHDRLLEKAGDLGEDYQKKVDGKWQTVKAVWTKEQADKLFCRMLREAGVPKFRRRMAYYAVRLFGKGSYK